MVCLCVSFLDHFESVKCWVIVFFFFKQKTAYEMRISDWSSDVCSSDLVALSSGHLWCVRYVGVHPLFEQAGCRPMGLQMGRIDHQLIRLPTLGSPRSEYLVEHAEPAPSDEAVVDRLGWAVFGRRVTPEDPKYVGLGKRRAVVVDSGG